MFGSPIRKTGQNGEAVFQLDVNVSPIGVEIEYNTDGLLYEKDIQTRFRTLQNLVLSELAKEKQLFKNPPTLASLEAITPNWGFVSSGSKMVFSPYATIISEIPDAKLPCLVDIQLKSIDISRSTIRAIWKLHYLGPKNPEIDFEWPAPAPTQSLIHEEIMEVSDVPVVTAGPPLTLTDPAARAREKMEAKQKVQAAFVSAEQARAAARELAQHFYENYDLSDSESAFTEWLSESDEEGSD